MNTRPFYKIFCRKEAHNWTEIRSHKINKGTYTGRFIMFSAITNIYKKENPSPSGRSVNYDEKQLIGKNIF
jgi:hypothetical protein